MIRRLTFIIITAALGLSAVDASAFFDDLTTNPRSRGMGETTVAVTDAAYAPLVNPAAMGTSTGGEVAASYLRPFRLDFTDYYVLAAGLPWDTKIGRFGVGLTHFKVAYEDVSLLKETQLTLAHGVELYSDYHSRIAFGWSANFYNVEAAESVSGLDPGSDLGFGLDFGLLVTLHKRTHLGLHVKNFNNPKIGIDEEELPRRITGGISYEPYDGVMTTFELDNELGENVQYHGGVEAFVIPEFALRAGVVTAPNRLTAGFGYYLDGFSINYGFSTGGGTLDSTHQFGLNYAWGGEAQ